MSAEDVLVQTSTRGIFPLPAPQTPGLTNVPGFTLYGDGTLLYWARDQGTRSYLLFQGELTEMAIQNILLRAVIEARFFDSEEYYYPMVMDAALTRITVNTSAECRSVFALALGPNLPVELMGLSTEDAAQFGRLGELYQWLKEMDLRMVDDPERVDRGKFIPDAIELFITRIGPELVYEEATLWPFTEIDLASSDLWPAGPTTITLEDDLAHQVYEFLTDMPRYNFSQGDVVAFVQQRPHLPYEGKWREANLCP